MEYHKGLLIKVKPIEADKRFIEEIVCENPFIVKPMQGWEPYSDVIFKENRNSIENFLVEQK
jgi:hypothetical protein